MNEQLGDLSYRLTFEFSGFWQLGSGRGSGFVTNSLTARSSDGLPFIPGRTVKGLVREAVRTTARYQSFLSDREIVWFGKPTSKGITRFETEPGALGFEDGQLQAELRRWLVNHPKREDLQEGLYRRLSATAINEQDGIAKENSLRSYEVVVPLTLHAPLFSVDPERLERVCPDWSGELALCLTMLRAMGQQRNRGFGRVKVILEHYAAEAWHGVEPIDKEVAQ